MASIRATLSVEIDNAGSTDQQVYTRVRAENVGDDPRFLASEVRKVTAKLTSQMGELVACANGGLSDARVPMTATPPGGVTPPVTTAETPRHRG